MRSLTRSGTYLRVFSPDWSDPLDTTPSRISGGRWNPPGAFGALHLCADRTVAAANARAQHAGRAIGLFDLEPERRPHVLQLHVPRSTCVDVVTAAGVGDVRLPARYPFGVGHDRCRRIGQAAYRDGSYRGIACRSAAECRPTAWVGEELAWFDSAPVLSEDGRADFANWYPDPIP
ncbi:MAG: RES domain-containing protein [Candidatus Dormibacteria bacterium]